PGVPAVREGPGRDHPPGPDRRRRSHRPAWPRSPHLALARRLAPRAPMAKPARHGLRTARRSGLTSPDPVRTRHAATATPTPAPEPGTPDQPQDKRAAGRPCPDSSPKTPRAEIGPETAYRNRPVDRGLGDPAFVLTVRPSAI